MYQRNQWFLRKHHSLYYQIQNQLPFLRFHRFL